MPKYFLKIKPELENTYQHKNIYFNTLVDSLNYWISYKYYDKLFESFVKSFISIDISICDKYKVIKTLSNKYKKKKFSIITHPNLVQTWKHNLKNNNCKIFDINSISYEYCDFIICDVINLCDKITKFENYKNIRTISFYNFIKKNCFNVFISPTAIHLNNFINKNIKSVKVVQKIDNCFICTIKSKCYRTGCCGNEICKVCFEKCNSCPYCREINFSKTFNYKNKLKNFTHLDPYNFKLPQLISLEKINFLLTNNNNNNIDIIKKVFTYYVNCKIYLIK
uniref:RING-type domain-containing protein n=1 Tax=viral metagenome TaxID=1070528 RepID=A0A6C0JB66_9ZZZZ